METQGLDLAHISDLSASLVNLVEAKIINCNEARAVLRRYGMTELQMPMRDPTVTNSPAVVNNLHVMRDLSGQ